MADQINKLPPSPNIDSSVTKPTWDWFIKIGKTVNQVVDWVNGYSAPTTVPAHASTHARGAGDAVSADSIFPAQTGNSGKVLTTDGTTATWGIISGTPAGAVMPFAMATPPAGWLECKGQLVSRTNYAALFAAIGTAFGAGDGSTFGLPELRGEFVRGWDDARGVDTGRTFGSAQGQDIQPHAHTVPSRYQASPWNGGGVAATDAGGTAVGTPTASVGTTETRPRNIALLYCIKT